VETLNRTTTTAGASSSDQDHVASNDSANLFAGAVFDYPLPVCGQFAARPYFRASVIEKI
jgi:hypothetical protein